ncbi:27111_t:CDS:2, partial [Gigaspora margarita]
FYYEIIEESVYLNASQSAYIFTSKEKQYKIPDQYAVINPNSKTMWSGILIFGLQLESVKTAHNAKNRELKSIENSAVNSTIPREGTISNERVLLNKQMEANIRITQVNLYHLEVEKDSTDAFEQGMIDKIDKIEAQHSIKNLLNYIIPYLKQSNILKCTDPVVYLRISGLYNDKSRKIIVNEMKRINVTFQFWENHETHNWNYTSLMVKDKLKVLQLFNFGVLFCPSNAKLIRQLWDQFYSLY